MESPIGLFGGTFSPVHHGHLRSALDICQALELSSVTLIPNYQSPHKAAQDVSAQHRLAMLKLATSISPMLNISDIEISSANTSYTVDTVRSFRAQYPDRPLCFLMGMDSL
ncbi:MAG: nicotinate-nicotinamide nucleotide adenylyltransferase, partial [Psychrobium sp.]